MSSERFDSLVGSSSTLKGAHFLLTFWFDNWQQNGNVTKLMRFIQKGQSADPKRRGDISPSVDWSISGQTFPTSWTLKQKRPLDETANKKNTKLFLPIEHAVLKYKMWHMALDFFVYGALKACVSHLTRIVTLMTLGCLLWILFSIHIEQQPWQQMPPLHRLHLGRR